MEHQTKRILVVDDKPNNLSLVTSLLRPDYEVLLANNGERALIIAQEKLPDLILLDIMMPGMSGFEVCEILKKNPTTVDIPVIFLTARNDNDDFEKAYDIGAVDYTTKPINAKELMMRVKTHLLISEQKNNLLRLNERITHINEELEDEVAKRTHALTRAKENLERQNTDLTQFSHIISHNLRGPVASALGLLQLFDFKNSSNPINADVLLRMADSVKNINSILKDISAVLELREKLMGSPVEFEVEPSLNAVVLKVKENIPANFKFEIRTHLELNRMTSYQSYFETILFHILENAFRFSEPSRKAEIDIYVRSVKGFYEVEVSDNGIGVDEKDFERVFEPFKKLNYESTGRGLGLYQVKTMLNHLGGNVSLSSKVGKGSSFIVRLPIF